MPAHATVSPEQVLEAATILQNDGKRISGWTLRRIIGAGDPARLEAIWREHAAAAAEVERDAEDVAHTLPPSVADHLAAAEARVLANVRGIVSQIWKGASDLAAQRVAQEVSDARARVAELEEELAEARSALAVADDDLSRMTAKYGDAHLKAEMGRGSVQEAAAARAAAEARAEAAEQRAVAAEARAEAAEARADQALERVTAALAGKKG